MGSKSSHIIPYDIAIKRCTPRDIERWSSGFRRLCPKEKFYLERQTFIKEVLGPNVPRELAERIFRVMATQGESMSEHDFICGMVILFKSTPDEKTKFVFNVYDSEYNGFITKEDMEKVIAGSGSGSEKKAGKQLIEECFNQSANQGKLTLKEWKKLVTDNRFAKLPLMEWIHYEKKSYRG